jgi:hypothetical protein
MTHDALAIANLKARYCMAADMAAQDGTAARSLFWGLFTDDFIGNYGDAPIVGASAITVFLCTAIAGGSRWMIHMLHSPLIHIDGDRARGDWTVLVHSRRRDTGAMMQVLGRYSDAFIRTKDGWRLSAVTFTRPE